MEKLRNIDNIVLVGFMGSGKTSVGLILSKKLNKEFVDSDIVIENKLQQKITEIFAEKGENFFRDTETEVLKELSKKKNMVLAVGGGAVLKKENIEILLATGVVVCLMVSIEEAIKRIENQKDRPLIEKSNKVETIKDIYLKRQAIYESFSLKVYTDGKTPEAVANEIIDILKIKTNC